MKSAAGKQIDCALHTVYLCGMSIPHVQFGTARRKPPGSQARHALPCTHCQLSKSPFAVRGGSMQCLTCNTSGAGTNLSAQDVYMCNCQSQLIACAAQVHCESILHGSATNNDGSSPNGPAEGHLQRLASDQPLRASSTSLKLTAAGSAELQYCQGRGGTASAMALTRN